MNFSCLVGKEGEVFREDCKRSGKKVMLWTVDRREEMIEVGDSLPRNGASSHLVFIFSLLSRPSVGMWTLSSLMSRRNI